MIGLNCVAYVIGTVSACLFTEYTRVEGLLMKVK